MKRLDVGPEPSWTETFQTGESLALLSRWWRAVPLHASFYTSTLLTFLPMSRKNVNDQLVTSSHFLLMTVYPLSRNVPMKRRRQMSTRGNVSILKSAPVIDHRSVSKRTKSVDFEKNRHDLPEMLCTVHLHHGHILTDKCISKWQVGFI